MGVQEDRFGSSLRACRARPSKGGQAQAELPGGESPEMVPRAVFSEGRTLCVRVARPHASRGIPFPPDACARGRGPNAENSPRSQCRHCGRAEPAPPRNGQAMGRRPSGGKPGDGAKAGFPGAAPLLPGRAGSGLGNFQPMASTLQASSPLLPVNFRCPKYGCRCGLRACVVSSIS
jgi:hypothetical protein